MSGPCIQSEPFDIKYDKGLTASLLAQWKKIFCTNHTVSIIMQPISCSRLRILSLNKWNILQFSALLSDYHVLNSSTFNSFFKSIEQNELPYSD